jgi:hypothetical protein
VSEHIDEDELWVKVAKEEATPDEVARAARDLIRKHGPKGVRDVEDELKRKKREREREILIRQVELTLHALRHEGEAPVLSRWNMPLNWAVAFDKDREIIWLVRDVWPDGSSVAIHAKAKTGKSLLMLWMAANLSIGRDPFTGATIAPKRTGYFDNEMNERQIVDRLEEMGFDEGQLGNLSYHLFSGVGALDTASGGADFLDCIRHFKLDAVVLDTFSRFVIGKENENDTYRAYHDHTGSQLKAAGIPICRLDHEGHGKDATHARGASAKGDDVDIDFQLRVKEEGYQLVRTMAREGNIPAIINIKMANDPSLAFSRSDVPTWQPGTAEKAKELDALGIPTDWGRTRVAKWMREHGLTPGRNEVLTDAIKFRNDPIANFIGGKT